MLGKATERVWTLEDEDCTEVGKSRVNVGREYNWEHVMFDTSICTKAGHNMLENS